MKKLAIPAKAVSAKDSDGGAACFFVLYGIENQENSRINCRSYNFVRENGVRRLSKLAEEQVDLCNSGNAGCGPAGRFGLSGGSKTKRLALHQRAELRAWRKAVQSR
jgi:hypothetical protein